MEPYGSLLHSQAPATCPYSEPHQLIPCPPYHFLKIHLNIIHPPMPGSSKWPFSLSFPTKNLYAPLISATHAACPIHLILLHLITWIIFDREYRSLGSSLCSFFPLPCYLNPLRPKYSPRYTILKHPHPTFLPECKWTSFTPLQNRSNYNCIYFSTHLYTFGYQAKILVTKHIKDVIMYPVYVVLQVF